MNSFHYLVKKPLTYKPEKAFQMIWKAFSILKHYIISALRLQRILLQIQIKQ
jgi:hypothetical protein